MLPVFKTAFKNLALYAFAISTLGLSSKQAFSQNKIDMSSRQPSPVYSMDHTNILSQMKSAKLDSNPMAQKITTQKINEGESIHWGNVNDPLTKNLSVAKVLKQAKEEQKTLLDFELDGEAYIIAIPDLQELQSAHSSYYNPEDTVNHKIDIQLNADEDFALEHDYDFHSSTTTISAHTMAYFSKEALTVLCAHEVGHDKEKPDAFVVNDVKDIANRSLALEYNADKKMFEKVGVEKTVKALLSSAGYFNFRVENANDPEEKSFWLQKQKEAYAFTNPKKPLIEAHPSLANRILYQYALDDGRKHDKDIDLIATPSSHASNHKKPKR